MEPVIINTIGDLIDRGYRIGVGCRRCHRNGWIDLEALALKRGRDYPYDKIRPYCSRCGSRDIAVTNHAR